MTSYKTTGKHRRLGFEVSFNLKDLHSQQKQLLKQALWEHGVIFARNQHLSACEMEQFARETFDPMMVGDNRRRTNRPVLPPELVSNHVAVLGNPLGPTERPIESAAWQWHHDKDALPSLEGVPMHALYVVMLHLHNVPPMAADGQPHTTHFLDQQEAWRSLPPERQAELRQVEALHAPPFQTPASWTAQTPLKRHPLVSVHRVTGKEGLYMGSDTAIPDGFEGQPEAAKVYWHALLAEMLSRCTVYAHTWQKGDVVLWDNSQVMHCGRPYDSMRYQRIGLRLGFIVPKENAQ